MEKPDYYLKRTDDRVKQCGKALDEIIQIHNRMTMYLTDAVNFYRLASAAINRTLCDVCPLEATVTKDDKHYCDKHWEEVQNKPKEASKKQPIVVK